MFASLPTTAFVIAILSSIAHGGTSIPIDLYTDIECEKPSTSNSNVSLALDTCAVTPGLGSLVLNPFPCTSGVVQVYAFSDTVCGTQDDIFSGISHCMERATDGVYAAIMLSCDQEEPGSPTATTTIPVGPIATSSGEGNDTSSSGSSSSPSSPTSSTDTGSSTDTSSSGWDSLSTGGKVGIPIGSIVGLILSIFGGFRYKRYRNNKQAAIIAQSHPNSSSHQPNVVQYAPQYPKNAFDGYGGPNSYIGSNNFQTDVAGNPINSDGSNNSSYGGPNSGYGSPGPNNNNYPPSSNYGG